MDANFGPPILGARICLEYGALPRLAQDRAQLTGFFFDSAFRLHIEGRREINGALPPDLLGVMRAPRGFVTSAKRRFVSEFRAENLLFLAGRKA